MRVLGAQTQNYRPMVCCFLLHIDLFTHSADMLAQGPSSHHSTHGTLIKRLADRFTGITVNTSHQGQSILQSSILAYWTLSGIDPGTNNLYYHRVPVPFWDRHPGSGPQFVVAERVFRREIQWRRLHGSLFKYGKASQLYGGNTQFINDRQAATIVQRKRQLVQE